MICLAIILIIIGGLLMALCTGAVALIDPIICILIIYGVYRLAKKLLSKK